MHSFPLVDWLDDYGRAGVDPLAQREYVARELRRIAAAGAAVLSHALSAPLDVQQHLAVSVLSTDDEWRDFRPHLRIVPGYELKGRFLRNAEAQNLPPEKAGKVLRAKLGNKGGRVSGTMLPESVTAGNRPEALRRNEMLGKENYLYRDIGYEPVAVPVSEAVLILRQYGHGLREQRYQDKGAVDYWIVEEVPPHAVDRCRDEARAAAKAKADAALEAATAPDPQPRKKG